MNDDSTLQRQAAAYHEAGHAVVAMYYGWSISPEGVEIDERQYTGLRRSAYDRLRERPVVVISLAGWCAEHKWHGLGGPAHSDDGDLEYMIDVVRRGWEEDETEGDDGDAIRHLLKLHPEATDAELIAAYRRYEAETWALLEDPERWSEIELVAAELLKHGKITAMCAHRVAGYPDPR
jgi:hypothetical protein